MALVNPQIAMSYRPTVEYQPRNALADAAQVMSLQQAQMQMDKLRRTDEAIERIRQVSMKEGGPSDTMEIAKAFLSSPVAEHQTMGFKIYQQQRDKADFDRVLGRLYPDLLTSRQTSPAAAAATATATAAAPAAASQGDLVAAPMPSPKGVMQDIAPGGAAGPETPLSYLKSQFGTPSTPAAATGTNALPAAVGATAPAAAPVVNAMAAPGAAPAAGKTADQLRQEIIMLSGLSDPRAKALAEVLKGQLSELTKTHTVGGRIVTGGGREIYTAPSQIGAIEAEIADLRQKGVKDNDPRIVARLGKIGQLSGAGAPLDITRAMAERDRLIASGRTADAQALSDFIRKQTTHQPAAQQNVYAYTPASEVAQQDFMRGARATYDTLKNAPATLKNIEAAKELIPSAAGFMGPGGEPLLKAASFLNNRFGTSISTKGVTDATELRTRLFNGVIDNLRKLDAQPTAAQQQVLQDAIGNLGTDPSALPRVLDAMAQSVRDKVDLYNRDVTGAEQRGVRFPYKPQIDLPPPKSASGAAAQQIPGAAPATAIPQAAINDLKAGRGTDAQFDAIFGAGAAKRVRGGK